jgi:hypothetical protein
MSIKAIDQFISEVDTLARLHHYPVDDTPELVELKSRAASIVHAGDADFWLLALLEDMRPDVSVSGALHFRPRVRASVLLPETVVRRMLPQLGSTMNAISVDQEGTSLILGARTLVRFAGAAMRRLPGSSVQNAYNDPTYLIRAFTGLSVQIDPDGQGLEISRAAQGRNSFGDWVVKAR